VKPPARAPSGPERRVVFLGSAAIGGAPVAYVVVLAAVVAVLSFLPFSIALSAGSSFPVAQGVYPLMGWLLGPEAGAVASGAGALLGVVLAPHTAGIPWLTVGGAALAAVVAGALAPSRGRLAAGLVLGAAIVAALFYRQAVVANGVRPLAFGLAYLTHGVALALLALPARSWIGRAIASPDLQRVALGLFLGTWCADGLMMLVESAAAYAILNWPEPLFGLFAVVIPLEHGARCALGAAIGTGVIAGLRAMGVVKPGGAAY
jgi:hypothetical protein